MPGSVIGEKGENSGRVSSTGASVDAIQGVWVVKGRRKRLHLRSRFFEDWNLKGAESPFQSVRKRRGTTTATILNSLNGKERQEGANGRVWF